MAKGVNNTESDGTSASIMHGGSTTEVNMNEINKGYIAMNCFTISLGFMQFGVGMNSYSTLAPAFVYHW